MALVAIACDVQGIDWPMVYVLRSEVTFETWIDATCTLGRRWRLKKVGATLLLDEHRHVLFAGGRLGPSFVRDLPGILQESPPSVVASEPGVDRRVTQVELLAQAAGNLMSRRRVDEAVASLRQARALDPDNEILPRQTGALREPSRFYAGDIDEAWLSARPRLAP